MGMWSLELAVAGNKVVAGSDGNIAWRHTPLRSAGQIIGEVLRPLDNERCGIKDSSLKLKHLEKLILAFDNSEIPKGLQNLTNLAFLSCQMLVLLGRFPWNYPYEGAWPVLISPPFLRTSSIP